VLFEDAKVDQALFKDFVQLLAVIQFLGDTVLVEDLILQHLDLGLGDSLALVVDGSEEEFQRKDFKIASFLVAGIRQQVFSRLDSFKRR